MKSVNDLQNRNKKKLCLPITASYKLKNENNGFADGIISVTVDETNNCATDIIPYWADKNGILEGFCSLYPFRITGAVTEFEISSDVIIPKDATRLLLYAYDYDTNETTNDYYEISLPKGMAPNEEYGKLLAEFQVISDIHIQDNCHNIAYKILLKKVRKISPQSIGLFVVGDMTNNGRISEYEKHNQIYSSINGIPDCFFTIGNHEFYDGGQAAQKEIEKRFISYAKKPDGTSPSSQHYDFWINGYHFVFWGNDGITKDLLSATFTDETLSWLNNTLLEKRDIKKPTFLFCHYPLISTVSGSLGEFKNGAFTGIYGENATKLKAILKKFPEVVLFTGHQHFVLGFPNTMHKRDENLPTIFNTSSASQTATCRDGIKKKGSGSEGYFVYVYEDKVIVRGFDFISSQWIPSAQFYVDFYDLKEK